MCFALRRRQRLVEVPLFGHDPHATTAAAHGRLDQQGIAKARGVFGETAGGLVRAVVAGNDRRAGRRHQALRLDLRTHGTDGVRRRTDERRARLANRSREIGILGQEPVARMNGLCAAVGNCRQQGRLIEVAVGHWSGPNAQGSVRFFDVDSAGIGIRVDGDSPDTHPSSGSNHASGDLAAIGDK